MIIKLIVIVVVEASTHRNQGRQDQEEEQQRHSPVMKAAKEEQFHDFQLVIFFFDNDIPVKRADLSSSIAMCQTSEHHHLGEKLQGKQMNECTVKPKVRVER